MKRKKLTASMIALVMSVKPARDNLCRQLVSGRWQRYGKRKTIPDRR